MKYRNCDGKLKSRKGRQLKWLCKELKQFKKQQKKRGWDKPYKIHK